MVLVLSWFRISIPPGLVLILILCSLDKVLVLGWHGCDYNATLASLCSSLSAVSSAEAQGDKTTGTTSCLQHADGPLCSELKKLKKLKKKKAADIFCFLEIKAGLTCCFLSFFPLSLESVCVCLAAGQSFSQRVGGGSSGGGSLL